MYNLKPVDKINPTTTKQYSYCPVIPWIQTMLGVQEPTTDSMMLGREAYTQLRGEGQVYISTEEGATIIDELVEEGKHKVIIERKAYKSHNHSRYIEQAVTTYIIARKKIPGIRRIKIEIQGTQREIELVEDLVKDTENLIKQLAETIKNEKPPTTKPNPKKCTSCWYKRYCPHH